MAQQVFSNFEKDVTGKIESFRDVEVMLERFARSIRRQFDFIGSRVDSGQESSVGPVTSIVFGTQAGVSIGLRSNQVNVTANVPKAVTFAQNMTSALYYLRADFYNSAGEWVTSVLPTDQTASGFTIQAPENGTVKYIAVEFR